MYLTKSYDRVFNPFDLVEDVVRQMNPLTSRMIEGDVFGANYRVLDDKYVFEIAVPGFKKEDLKVTVNGTLLTVAAKAKTETEEERNSYSFREFGERSLCRSFKLPSDGDGKSMSAKCEDGVLVVSVPRSEEHGALTVEVE